MKTNLSVSILLMLFLLCVAGCPKQPEKKLTPKQPVSKVETPHVAPLMEAVKAVEEGYTYNPRGRRDPFKSLLVKVEKIEEELPPLQKVDSADLKLTAILWDQTAYFAMVETPEGRGFVVREGTIVGLNKGIVKKITPRDLTIEERVKTYLGESKIREVILELRKREEGR